MQRWPYDRIIGRQCDDGQCDHYTLVTAMIDSDDRKVIIQVSHHRTMATVMTVNDHRGQCDDHIIVIVVKNAGHSDDGRCDMVTVMMVMCHLRGRSGGRGKKTHATTKDPRACPARSRRSRPGAPSCGRLCRRRALVRESARWRFS